MDRWIEQRERTIAVPDRELHDIWFDRGATTPKMPPQSELVIASGGSAISDAVLETIQGATRTLAIGSFLIGSDAVVTEIERAWQRGAKDSLQSRACVIYYERGPVQPSKLRQCSA